MTLSRMLFPFVTLAALVLVAAFSQPTSASAAFDCNNKFCLGPRCLNQTGGPSTNCTEGDECKWGPCTPQL